MNKGQLRRKEHKVRTTKGSVTRRKKERTSKKSCALCRQILHGTPHGLIQSHERALSRTEKRPSVRYGGVLCGGCRRHIVEEAVKVRHQLKTLTDTRLSERLFIENEIQRL